MYTFLIMHKINNREYEPRVEVSKQPNNSEPRSLQERRLACLEEAKRLRIEIGETEKNDDGNIELAAQVAGRLKALKKLLSGTEMELIELDQKMIDQERRYAVHDNKPNNWNDAGQTGGNVRMDRGQSEV